MAALHFCDKDILLFKNDAFILKGLFTQKLLNLILPRLDTVDYEERKYLIGPNAYCNEYVGRASFLNHVVQILNDQDFVHFLKDLTKDPMLSTFKGRLYMLKPDSSQSMGWHNDLDSNKSYAISINVSPKPFVGGELLIRNKKTQEITKIHNIGFGDAIVFKIHEDYEHMVETVTGEHSKIAITGWYHSEQNS